MVDFDALLPHPPLPPGPPELTHFPLPFSQSHQPSSQLEFAVCELVSVKEVYVGGCGCVCGCVRWTCNLLVTTYLSLQNKPDYRFYSNLCLPHKRSPHPNRVIVISINGRQSRNGLWAQQPLYHIYNLFPLSISFSPF